MHNCFAKKAYILKLSSNKMKRGLLVAIALIFILGATYFFLTSGNETITGQGTIEIEDHHRSPLIAMAIFGLAILGLCHFSRRVNASS